MRSRCFRAIKSACNQVGPLVGACYDRVINVPRKSYRVASFEFVIFFRMGNLPLLRSSSLASRPRYSASLSLSLLSPLAPSDNKKGSEITRCLTTDPQEALAVKASKILAHSALKNVQARSQCNENLARTSSREESCYIRSVAPGSR